MSVIEICVDNAEGVEAARVGQADRVELCSQLWCGGLTPCDEQVVASLSCAPPLGVQFLIRSRAGNFVYDTDEISEMLDDIARIGELVRTHGPEIPHGFVVGAVTSQGNIDEEAARLFREAAGSHDLTFHRAFDTLINPFKSLRQLIDLGFQRILTTGGSLYNGDISAADYRGLRTLVRESDERITILASGGLRSHNVAQALGASGVTQVHMRAPHPDGQGTHLGEIRRIVKAVRGHV